MAGTTRSRKAPASKATAATDQATDRPAEENTAVAAEVTPDTSESAGGADDAPVAPDAAPLEPPAVQEPPAAPEAPAFASATEVIPDEENLAEVIIDDATGEPPADVDRVFMPLTPRGSSLICTVRLVEQTFLGPHSNPVHRLLQPAGAHVSESVAARILERLRAQHARLLAAETEK
ncbi:hypothetical protein ACIQU7_23575 [Streptomyces albidoflavus]